MPLTGSPATDERDLREAIRDTIVSFTDPDYFPGSHVFTRERRPKDLETWKAIMLIDNPDDPSRRLLRMVTVTTIRSRFTPGNWTYKGLVQVGFGFVDERPPVTDPGPSQGNSQDDLSAYIYSLIDLFRTSRGFGLDEAITVTAVEHVNTRFLPRTKELDSAHIADITVEATIVYCC